MLMFKSSPKGGKRKKKIIIVTCVNPIPPSDTFLPAYTPNALFSVVLIVLLDLDECIMQ